jgi:hypothetical protein
MLISNWMEWISRFGCSRISHFSARLSGVVTYRAIAILSIKRLGCRPGEEPISRKALETSDALLDCFVD